MVLQLNRSWCLFTAGLVTVGCLGAGGAAASHPVPVAPPTVDSPSDAAEAVVARAGFVVEMLGDLHPGPESSTPAEQRAAGGRVFFAADDGTHGREPWVSDGTAAGTVMVADLEPGNDGSWPQYFTAAEHGVVFGTATRDGPDPWVGSLWTTTATGTNGDAGQTELLSSGTTLLPYNGAPLGDLAIMSTSDFGSTGTLWRSDGTPDGTFTIHDELFAGTLAPVADFMMIEQFQNELWRTDGTRAGTHRILTFPDGNTGTTTMHRHTVAGARLYFTTLVDRFGDELWSSDGTRAGTRVVADLRPGTPGSRPRWLAAQGRRLYFVAGDGRNGRQLWRTNGTGRGTVRLTDLGRSHIRRVTPCGKVVYFTNTDRRGKVLWVRTQQRVRRVVAGAEPAAMACAAGRLVFTADHGRRGRELWTLTGPRAEPVLHDLAPGRTSSNPTKLFGVGRRVYFEADDGTHGREPWVIRPRG